MSSSAIVMMVIGCGLLWGGFAFSVGYYFHTVKKKKNESR